MNISKNKSRWIIGTKFLFSLKDKLRLKDVNAKKVSVEMDIVNVEIVVKLVMINVVVLKKLAKINHNLKLKFKKKIYNIVNVKLDVKKSIVLVLTKV